MLRLVVKHSLLAIGVVFSAITVTFFLTRLGPDPVTLILPQGSSAEQRDELRASLGLDRPVLVQYLDYLGGAVQGDFGRSYFSSQTVTSAVMTALPNTFLLAVVAFLLTVVLAVPIGTLCAMRPNGVLDRVVQLVCVVGNSMPSFWAAILLLDIFAVRLGLFPTFGRTGPASLVLPSITIALYMFPLVARLTRSSMLASLSSAYVETAEAVGLRRGRIIGVHVMRNGSVPVLSLLGVQLGALLGGAIITETVFSWPGIGALAVSAISKNDIPMIQGIVAVIAIIFAVVTLGTEILVRLANPRLR